MIVSFSVSNFRSFAEEETLNLVASNRLPDSHPCHLVPIPGAEEKLLRAAVLYGANGAGKSNLFRALKYLDSMVTRQRSKKSGTNRETFRFGDFQHQPSSFDLQFITEDTLYRFGFKVDDQYVTEEWLARIEGGREKTVYERTTNSDGTVTVDAPGLKGSGDKIKALATVGGPPNQTFLATIRITLAQSEYGEDISRILYWFENRLRLVAPDASFAGLGHQLSRKPDFLKFAGEFLNASATGIDRLNVKREEITEEQFKNLVGDEKRVKALLRLAEENEVAYTQISKDVELIAENTGGYRFFLVSIQSTHKFGKKEVPLDFSFESDGTRRLLNLIPALHHMRTSNGVYVIDEIDRSMHPLLTWKFLEFFLSACTQGRSQIMVTTHESNLLDLELLRRDEIWFAEKNDLGATKLYSLSDYKVRTDLALRKHYLQGRFGAVPFLGNLDRLLETETAR